jgi:cytochrome c peroxidase
MTKIFALHGPASSAAASLIILGLVSAANAQTTDLTAIEELGKFIFFDESLSINGNQSCASCHDPSAGWTGPDSDINWLGSVYPGSITNRFGNRKPPSSAYATPSPVLFADKKGLFMGGNFWDGRATGEKLGNPAADQAQGPFVNPAEQALQDPACVVYLVCTGAYGDLFEDVWGPGVCDIEWPPNIDELCSTESGPVPLSDDDRAKVEQAYDMIALSIATYEASSEVNAFTSKYDYYLAGVVDLTKEEKKGLNLFKGKAKCSKCHPAKGSQPLFTDFTFDNLGVPANPLNPQEEFVDHGLGGFLVTRPEWSDLAEENDGKHKVPTLRNVDLRPYDGFVKAYTHNGFFKSLKEVVHFYNTRDVGDWPDPEIEFNVNTAELGDLKLTDEEEDAIVEFLKTLSDGYSP